MLVSPFQFVWSCLFLCPSTVSERWRRWLAWIITVRKAASAALNSEAFDALENLKSWKHREVRYLTRTNFMSIPFICLCVCQSTCPCAKGSVRLRPVKELRRVLVHSGFEKAPILTGSRSIEQCITSVTRKKRTRRIVSRLLSNWSLYNSSVW